GRPLGKSVNMSRNIINSITLITAYGPIPSGTSNTNTLASPSNLLHIKSEFVLLKCNDNTRYVYAHIGGVLTWNVFAYVVF
ncbi:MAG: hypothetical protein ACKPKO_42290, partial [Candidatus Fonsibacter sp.]